MGIKLPTIKDKKVDAAPAVETKVETTAPAVETVTEPTVKKVSLDKFVATLVKIPNGVSLTGVKTLEDVKSKFKGKIVMSKFVEKLITTHLK